MTGFDQRIGRGPTRSRSILIATLIVAAIFAGCSSDPTDPTPSTAVPPTACIGLQPAPCKIALLALAANPIGDGTPSYVAVTERFCDGPCPGSERGVWLGHLMVEFSDGRKAATVLIEVDGAAVDWQPIETVLFRITPVSQRLAAPSIPFVLGHCGLASGIDVDGTFWNPVGQFDLDAELINSANATFMLTSPNTATVRTVGGTVVQLVRHLASAKYLVGCD